MTTKNELRSKKRHRFMVKGPVGSGKSFILVLLAKRYALLGKKVLYIDFRDIGAADELLKLDEKVLANIRYETPQEYDNLISIQIPKNTGLVIFDAMHHLRFRARKYIVEHYLRQGHYTVSGVETKIEDLETFDLGVLGGWGTGYGAANLREGNVIDKILNASCDVAISVIPDPPKDKGDTFTEILEGSFDNIIKLSFRDSDRGTREWFYSLYRWRGIETNDYGEHFCETDEDPFAIIEATGGKPVITYLVRYTENNEHKRVFIEGTDTEEVKVAFEKDNPKVKEVNVVE